MSLMKERLEIHGLRLARRFGRAQIQALPRDGGTDQTTRRNDLDDFVNAICRQKIDQDASIDDRRLVGEQGKRSYLPPRVWAKSGAMGVNSPPFST